METFVLGVAGGSGAGKSTLSYGLEDLYPNQVTVFHIDDYFLPMNQLPLYQEMPNWDSPESIRDELMVNDLWHLKEGEDVIINTKSPRLNPDYKMTDKRIPVTFHARPLIVAEGFLALHFEKLRELFDLSIFLDAPFETHVGRRVHPLPENYGEIVIRPMHERYVLPSKQFADEVIDVSVLSSVEVLQKVTTLLAIRNVHLKAGNTTG